MFKEVIINVASMQLECSPLVDYVCFVNVRAYCDVEIAIANTCTLNMHSQSLNHNSPLYVVIVLISLYD